MVEFTTQKKKKTINQYLLECNFFSNVTQLKSVNELAAVNLNLKPYINYLHQKLYLNVYQFQIPKRKLHTLFSYSALNSFIIDVSYR